MSRPYTNMIWSAPTLTRFLLLLLTWGGLLFISPPATQAIEVKVDSTRFQFDSKNKIYRYEEARLQVLGMGLDAQLIEVFLNENRLVATGQVRFKEKTISGTAERIVVEMDRDYGELFNANLYDSANGYYLSAEKIIRSEPGKFTAFKCTLTSCKPGKGGWYLYNEKLDYRNDNFSVTTHSTLFLGPLPVLYTPVMAWPTVNQRRTGFLNPRMSRENSSLPRYDLGGRLKTPFFWALDQEHDLTLIPEWIERRGAALDLEYNYAFTENQKGQIRIFGIQESKDRFIADEEDGVTGFSQTEDPFRPGRYSARFFHNQGFGSHSRFVASLDRDSDGQARREYFKVERYRPHKVYNATLSNQSDWGNLSLSAGHSSEYEQESIFARTSEQSDGIRKPRIHPAFQYNIGGRPFGGFPLALELSAEVIRFEAEEGVSGEMRGLTPTLLLPFRLGNALEIRPRVAQQMVSFDKLSLRLPSHVSGPQESAQDAVDFSQQTRELEIRYALSRTYGKAEEANLKHRITPRMIYFNREDIAQPYSGSFTLSQLQELNAGNPVSLAAGVLTPGFTQRTLTLRLDNEWIARNSKHPTGVNRGSLNLIQRYNLDFMDEDFSPEGPAPDPGTLETSPGQHALPLLLEGNLSFDNLQMGLKLNYHHQKKKNTESFFSVSGSQKGKGGMNLSYYKLKNTYRTLDNELHTAGAYLTFGGHSIASGSTSLGFSGRINLGDTPPPLDQRLETSEIYLDYHPGCYSIRLTYSEKLSATTTGGVTEHFVDKTILLTFDLGGIISGTSTTSLTENNP